MFSSIIHDGYMFIYYKLSSATYVPSCHALKKNFMKLSLILSQYPFQDQCTELK